MVVFTCNRCGESLKKSIVAKHYQFRCRNPVNVTCMDCLMDFKGEEYVAHTTCISEAEKYSGKGYVPKASHNAGLRKQQTWVELVRSILSSKDVAITAEIRHFLQRMQDYDNVPRKKEKFLNFVNNSMGVRRFQAEPVWRVVESALEKFKKLQSELAAAKQSENKGNAEGKDVASEVPAEAKGHKEEAPEKISTNKKEKKKKKDGSAVNCAPESSETNGSLALQENILKKEKKAKKSKKLENKAEEITLQNGSPHVAESKVSKKKRKHAKEADGEQPYVEADSTTITNGNATNDDVPPKKKRKDPESEVTSTAKFSWKAEMLAVVQKNHNQIDLEKLKQKVFAKYNKVHMSTKPTSKMEKKFSKYLSISGLLVDGNVVKVSIEALE